MKVRGGGLVIRLKTNQSGSLTICSRVDLTLKAMLRTRHEGIPHITNEADTKLIRCWESPVIRSSGCL